MLRAERFKIMHLFVVLAVREILVLVPGVLVVVEPAADVLLRGAEDGHDGVAGLVELVLRGVHRCVT